MAPYKGLPIIEDNATPSPKNTRIQVPQSAQYSEKYSIRASLPTTQPGRNCPICEEAVYSPSDNQVAGRLGKASQQGDRREVVQALNGCTYHITCVQCRACRLPFFPQDSMTDWTWVGSSSPYHRTCMVQGAKPMLERLKHRLSMTKFATVSPTRQDPSTQMLPGLSRPSPHVLQASPRSSNDSVPSYRKADYLRSLPTLFSTRAGPEPCASCGRALIVAGESVPGPKATKHHVACLSACVDCGRSFGAKGTKWYAYGRRGLIRALCQECWTAGRERKEEVGR